jgi:hypothetical protein
VPDAFGIQLLGPGHRRWRPPNGEWRATDVGHGATLVEHIDLAAWYARPFPSSAPARSSRDADALPDVLVRARDTFSPLLLTDDVLIDFEAVRAQHWAQLRHFGRSVVEENPRLCGCRTIWSPGRRGQRSASTAALYSRRPPLSDG